MTNRFALIITNNTYSDQAFNPLKTPRVDGEGLKEVLTNPAIASFAPQNVIHLHDRPSAEIKRAVTDFYRNKRGDDFLLLYFSGHGALDAEGKLFFAVQDTEKEYLTTNGIEARFIDQAMKRSRAKRKVLVLDCCHSGAFVDGKGDPSINTGEFFDPKGYGHYILTATDKIQQAWEGHKVNPKYEHSLFTHHLLEGLSTGAAVKSTDQQITMDDLEHYVQQKLRQESNQKRTQTPKGWKDKAEGKFYIAKNIAYAPPQKEIKPVRTRHLMSFIDQLADFNIRAVCLDLGFPVTDDVGILLEQVSTQDKWDDLLDTLWDYHREEFAIKWKSRDYVKFIGQQNTASAESEGITTLGPQFVGWLVQYWQRPSGVIAFLLIIGLVSWLISSILSPEEPETIADVPVAIKTETPTSTTIAVEDWSYVDELSSSFVRSSANWYTGKNKCGFNNNAWYTVSTTDSVKSVNEGTWSFQVSTDGHYIVEAMVPACNVFANESFAAPYQVTHALGTTEIVINQSSHTGSWVRLGSFKFDVGKTYKVSLSDLTTDDGYVLWFDAIRFIVKEDKDTSQDEELLKATDMPEPNNELSDSFTVVDIDPRSVFGYEDDEWVKIPAGSFYFGIADRDTDADSNESPADRSFEIPYDYWISKFEVTNAQYKLFIDDGNIGHLPDTDCGIWNEDWTYDLKFENHPVVCVNWLDAKTYTDWLSFQLEQSGFEAMLPSEPEWEKAARGSADDRIYPWQGDFDGARLNCGGTDCLDDGFSGTAPSGSFSEGASPYGVEDMAGNVSEWTRSKYVAYPYDPDDGREDLTGDDRRVLRGGSWSNSQKVVRVSGRGRLEPNIRDVIIGFRVVIIRSPSQ